MRAACFLESGKPMEVMELPDPTPEPGEVVLKIAGCGICGSDLHVTELDAMVPSGTVMGHEFAGEIVAVGRGATGPGGPWREGDRVCTMPGISCGTCERCASGDVMGCAKLRSTGFGDIGGGFAEYAIGGDRMTFRLPENVTTADGAMVEPLAVGLHALDRAGLETGEDVLIVGAGPVGLACAIWARLLGAREVVVSDYVAHRRETAIAYGATAAIDPGREEVAPAFEKLTGHAPRLAFECVGRPDAVHEISLMVDRGGRILSAGMCMQVDQFMPLVFGTKELSIQFVSYYRHQDFQLTVDMLAAERIDPLPMISDRIALDALPAAFEALRKPTTECKVIVQP
ncbi:MAG: alcohol dehydrogenase [Deltaproteobacteria bacterium]|jgi:(R,R)-butanediol dehydrogenase/meso-butanediol dehydrogenase/diacetyl reductase|nr:alcohol dehydrogenase [Deltaproteobacteria bacterium]